MFTYTIYSYKCSWLCLNFLITSVHTCFRIAFVHGSAQFIHSVSAMFIDCSLSCQVHLKHIVTALLCFAFGIFAALLCLLLVLIYSWLFYVLLTTYVDGCIMISFQHLFTTALSCSASVLFTALLYLFTSSVHCSAMFIDIICSRLCYVSSQHLHSSVYISSFFSAFFLTLQCSFQHLFTTLPCSASVLFTALLCLFLSAFHGSAIFLFSIWSRRCYVSFQHLFTVLPCFFSASVHGSAMFF